MTDDLTPYLSPKVASILRLFRQYGSIETLRSAHPEITDEVVAEVTAEAKRAMAMALARPAASKRPAKSRGKALPGGDAYQLKITLRGSKPPIWRRVVVPADLTLSRLHVVIQLAMGWDDCHLHLFEIDGQTFQGPGPDGYLSDDMDFLDESQYRLSDLANRERAKFRYEYDFGDSWEHVILVEKIIPAADKPKVMVCTAGKGRCPMEDSGGIWGYHIKLSILANPKHSDYAEIREWIGDEFDPNQFDPVAASKALAMLEEPKGRRKGDMTD
ncbi:MAG: plasmid pRiA4b ORF-3 family protein [Tepidisphaeraceae bacterium]